MEGEDPNISLAKKLGMSVYPEVVSFRLKKEHYRKVPYGFVKKNLVLPIQEDQGVMIVAMADPLNIEPLEDLKLMLNLDVRPVYTPKEALENAIHECYNKEHGVAAELISNLSDQNEEGKGDGEVEVYDLLDDSKDTAPTIRMLNLIIAEAIQQGASDIHFEPQETGLKIRYRIDGTLQTRHAPAPEYQTQLLARIKVMSKLDIAEHRLPQDGRIKLRMGRREVDFRVSTVPVAGGERIVLRVLDKGNVILGLDKLGMFPTVFEDFNKLINMPEGIVLVTGPTGSGKTTTLYSAICEMYNDETNIMTIEDPVEYNLKGIAQIGVKPKINLTFAAGLRHILRQDPDIIMIGEIRDKETAEIAIQSALTGHLVLSTLHTNDAPSAITRLVDMGIEPYLLSSCIVGVLAQRLVRTICKHCCQPVQPTDKELQNLGLTKEMLPHGTFFQGTGCPACYGSGYKGRHGIYELMMVNNAIKKQIVKSPDAVELRNLAIENNMYSLLNHGADLAAKGITTVAEVLRSTRGVEEQG